MSRLQGKTVVLGITGGIAAYKAAELTSRLKKCGANVRVIMTRAACQFITPLTLETLSANRVVCDLFDRDFSWEVEHISLAKAADLFAVVPATANFIGKMAGGIADDMLTTTVMATRAPVLVTPAMNTGMYENAALQENLEKLRSRGVHFVEPESGRLACGDTGVGKLAPVERIFQALEELATEKDLSGLSVLITAGPTREPLDPVRFLSNHSTGKMGYALAQAAAARGARVTLVSGPVSLPEPTGVRVLHVGSAREMQQQVLALAPEAQWIIKAAAVGDYRPASMAEEKIKKTGDALTVELVRNPDILQQLGQQKRPDQLLCGFSMETQALLENSAEKMRRKNCDLMVANNLKVEGAGFAADTNVVTLLTPDGGVQPLERMSKREVADRLLDRLLALHRQKNPS